LVLLRPRRREYLSLLDTGERARAERFLHEVDRERYIFGHGLLRVLLGRYLNRPPGSIMLQRGEFGKPFLAGHPIHFNLSDTKDAVLLAVATEPIGADIETMDRRTDHKSVAGHFFTPREVGSIAGTADGKRRFLELWTRKEAVLKASGVGIMDDLHSLEVGEAHNTMTIVHPDFVRLAAPEYFVRTIHVGAEHVVSVASASPITEVQLFEGPPE
jgi:4'-phosphopantetheinyl transferase